MALKQLPQARTYDANLVLLAATTLTAPAAGTLILDLGEFPIRADLVVDVTAIDIADNDESYFVFLQHSPDADFGTAGNIQDGIGWQLSAKETKVTDSDKDDVIGRYVVPVTNVWRGEVYKYCRLFVIAGGTTDSITLSARLANMTPAP